MISVTNLTKIYDKQPAVDDVSFTLEKGKCIALLGPNGAGKTTTIRMMAGLISPSNGNVELQDLKVKDIRAHIGYLPQHPHFHSWMTGKEFLMYVGRLAHLSTKDAAARSEELLKRVGISDAKNRRIGKYSGGMKQRLGIAQALIHNPKLLMLDEPVSALDPIGRRDVLDLMEELKHETTILYSTHILSDAEEASDEILLMHKGRIVESGPLENVKKKHQVDKVSVRFSEQTEVYLKELEALDFVTRSETHKQTIHLYVTDIEAARDKILSLASQHKWPLQHFEIGQTKLEDLFMKVVNSDAMDDSI
ncbi:ABC transporter ATP-binding protein [Halobacillus mangrovi]|uniref:ABC transporter ATP-binding protein n=1 Tax=Halobacillus mangrovi TaxID=402384 RepID=A0A1W5ZYA2_9BACI|nr:ABC transporter ATP-binding protein [Halobacillus mangrovi]ARI78325.1 ABC transporter ATP-binding protein [Halobacillus mangrovi]